MSEGEFVTLRDYVEALIREHEKRFEQRFTAMERATSEQLASAKEAVLLSDSNTAQRDAKQNEWRKTLEDTNSRFVTRSLHEALEKRVEDLQARVNNMTGVDTGMKDTKAESNANKAMMLSTVSALIAVGSFIAMFVFQALP